MRLFPKSFEGCRLPEKRRHPEPFCYFLARGCFQTISQKEVEIVPVMLKRGSTMKELPFALRAAALP
ncbi:hypothetical protein C3920_12525 [Novacetimonas pomaceti]|uniref:Uncharacterized protein n=1 Tax=Novacetimonas pomaceti TaxID=2021998 RepID=A0ABX5NZP5_9PROT|nr:hypothetical protein C3920_12525 [Novacetimonas pomaceti]